MKKIRVLIAAVLSVILAFALLACVDDELGGPPSLPADNDPQKTLVVYFSCTNTTKTVAQYIQEELGCDIYEIKPKVPYTSADLNYGNDDSRTSKEQNNAKARPEIDGRIDNFDKYDVVFVGYPIWWGIAPRILFTFVESYDFAGKTVIPFCTSGSSGVGESASQLANAAKSGDWRNGTRLTSSKNSVLSWVKGLSA